MARALYRKYRPKCLSDVVGQTQVTDVLSEAIKRDKISHAYLFVGPRGTGKTSVARIFAHEINHFTYELEDDYVDIIEIDGASNRGIDDIRELREKAAIAPSEGKFKIYIIDEVHMLTKEAFNALLKTLEEPPSHVVFIMATTNVEKVPNTIISRAQMYTFRLADPATMQQFLRQVADAEKIKINDAALGIIVERGGGSFRDSLSLLDQISALSDQEITEQTVQSTLGLPAGAKMRELLEFYLAGDLSQIIASLKTMLQSGAKPEIIAENLIKTIVSDPQPALLGLLAELTKIEAPFVDAKLLVALTKNLQTAPQPTAVNLVPAPVAKPNKPEPAITPSKPSTTVGFNWDDFCTRIETVSRVIYEQLPNTTHEFIDGTVHIHPTNAKSRLILASLPNQKLMEKIVPGVKIKVHALDSDNNAKTASKDQPYGQLSDIIGGEVKEYGGENPFAA